MSEWEEFSAYRGIIQDAKNEALKEIIHDRKAIAAYATEKERERIIKLLERPENRDEWIYATRNTMGTYSNTVEFLVSLIKGENK